MDRHPVFQRAAKLEIELYLSAHSATAVEQRCSTSLRLSIFHTCSHLEVAVFVLRYVLSYSFF